jgi:SAM-dependent methyltransferase
MDWDERFLRGDELHGYVPSPPLPKAVQSVAPGRALDLACGAGRHAIFLAEHGWKVHAIDASRVGVQRMLDEAYKRAVSKQILAEVADIESPRFRIEGEHDLVCVFYFLHRPLFAQIRRAVRPGGMFVAAIHVRSVRDEQGQFLLEPGELRALFSDWEIVHSREGAAAESNHRHGAAELIARKPA